MNQETLLPAVQKYLGVCSDQKGFLFVQGADFMLLMFATRVSRAEMGVGGGLRVMRSDGMRPIFFMHQD